MISNRLKKLIIPYLLIHLAEEDWKYIEGMFEECYVIKEEGTERITLKPIPIANEIAMQFYTLNGAYVSITTWDYVKKHGELI